MIHDISYGRKGSQKLLEQLATEVGGFSVTSALGAGKGSPHSAGATGHLSGKGQTYDLSATGTGMTNTQLGQKLLKSEEVRGGHVIFNGKKYNIDEKGNISSVSNVKGHYDHVDVMLGEQAYQKYQQEEQQKAEKAKAMAKATEGLYQSENKNAPEKVQDAQQLPKFNPATANRISYQSPTGNDIFSSQMKTQDVVGR